MSFNDPPFGQKSRDAQRKPRTAPRGPKVPHVTTGGVEHKSCARCARLKPLTEFYPDTRKADGLSSYCRECACAGAAERYAKKKGNP